MWTMFAIFSFQAPLTSYPVYFVGPVLDMSHHSVRSSCVDDNRAYAHCVRKNVEEPMIT